MGSLDPNFSTTRVIRLQQASFASSTSWLAVHVALRILGHGGHEMGEFATKRIETAGGFGIRQEVWPAGVSQSPTHHGNPPPTCQVGIFGRNRSEVGLIVEKQSADSSEHQNRHLAFADQVVEVVTFIGGQINAELLFGDNRILPTYGQESRGNRRVESTEADDSLGWLITEPVLLA